MDAQYDVVILGAGPAGMSAAVYASRAGLKTAMLEKGAPGGKLVKTNEISNYPGFVTSGGPELALKMFEHSTAFGAEYLYGDVTKLNDLGEIKEIELMDGSTVTAKAVIIATGRDEKLLNVPGEQRYTGQGVSYCAVCDGAFFKDEEVAVIGGGNSALEEAMYLTQFAKKVYIVIRRDVFRADEIVQQQLAENDKIEVIRKHVPVEVTGENGKVCGIVLKNVETEEKMTLNVKAVFPYIGQDPGTSFVSHLDILDTQRYILTDEHMATKVPGIYAAGDVVAKTLRQVVTATSDGAIAAQSVFHYLKG
ncbi:MAG: thioredoxin-disulfide reductase [Erysipelotrichaceae bacterium]|jgi:thioredoxin reductase (NADPH)|nr:thioredoxin-disulfide reductase [Erysipelotrichaceae bacterium]